MFNISAIFKLTKKAHSTFNLFLMHFMSFVDYLKSKTIFKASLNDHVYWDTLVSFINYLKPKYESNRCHRTKNIGDSTER